MCEQLLCGHGQQFYNRGEEKAVVPPITSQYATVFLPLILLIALGKLFTHSLLELQYRQVVVPIRWGG